MESYNSSMKIHEVYDGHAGCYYYTVAETEDDAVKAVFNSIHPQERRRMLDHHEGVLRDLKAMGQYLDYPATLTDEDYLAELEVTETFEIKPGLVIVPTC